MTNGGSQTHGAGGRTDTDDGPVSPPQGRGRRRPAVLPNGRFLRTVLRRREGRVGLPRHRLDQARRRCRRADPDVRRTGPFGRILSCPTDPGRPPGGHRRADREPGRGAQGARLQGAGRARDHPPRHAGHADRGVAARIRLGQLARRDRPRRRGLGDRRRRHFDRPVRADRLRAGRARRGAGATGAGGDHCRGPGAGASHLRWKGRVRQRRGRARADDPVRPRHARRAGRTVPGRTGRGRRPSRLSRSDPEGRRVSCSTSRDESAARAIWRSIRRPARVSS